MTRYDTALVLHPDCGRHDTGWGHPEHQGRLRAVVEGLHRDTPAFLDRILQIEAEPAAIDAVLRVHDERMVRRAKAAADEAVQEDVLVRLDADTVVSPATWDAALAAAGCAVRAVDVVLHGDAPTAFALTRPPGHHATRDRSMGFCIFNNVAAAARHAQDRHGAERVLIVDWDVHHGNGTQDIFYADRSVYFLSFHLDAHYPGTGAAEERGEDAGRGFTRNVPLARGTSAAEYRARFEQVISDAYDAFEPDVVLVSAGFDCLSGDPLGGLSLEPGDLWWMTRELVQRAERVAVVLEGGYVPARVAEGARAVLRALAGQDYTPAHAG